VVILPRDTYTRQKWLIVATLFSLFVVPTAQSLSWSVFEWPAFPEYRNLDEDEEWYRDRMDLLKYTIALGLSVIGATWFLATRDSVRVSSDGPGYRLLSWAWTFIGLAILSGFLQIFLTYKAYHYWAKIVEEGYGSSYARARHCAYTRALQVTYMVTISYFVIGGVILVYAVTGLLHKTHSPESRDM